MIDHAQTQRGKATRRAWISQKRRKRIGFAGKPGGKVGIGTGKIRQMVGGIKGEY